MAVETFSDRDHSSYIDLSAIVAGAILALAISIVFLQFGSAIGLAAVNSVRWEGNQALGGVIGTGLWLLWVQITASMAGGYLAGRMRKPAIGAPHHEREIRDGAHGLLVWAAGTVAIAVAVALVSAFAAMATATGPHADDTQQAQNMLDLHRHEAVIFAFSAAASSFVSAAASWWAATMGGEHRDEAVDHSHYVSFRKR